MREWMKGIPEKLKEHQELIDKAMEDYELIEEFYYNLSTDDFNAKWTAIGWPHKIERQMETTMEQLDEDEERFRKLQMSDQATFDDKLDTLQVQYLMKISLSLSFFLSLSFSLSLSLSISLRIFLSFLCLSLLLSDFLSLSLILLSINHKCLIKPRLTTN